MIVAEGNWKCKMGVEKELEGCRLGREERLGGLVVMVGAVKKQYWSMNVNLHEMNAMVEKVLLAH